jgi:hypothetical protein
MHTAIAFPFFFRICHQESPRKSGRIGIDGTYQLLICVDDVIYWVKT